MLWLLIVFILYDFQSTFNTPLWKVLERIEFKETRFGFLASMMKDIIISLTYVSAYLFVCIWYYNILFEIYRCIKYFVVS